MKRFSFYELRYNNYSVFYMYDHKEQSIVSIIHEPCRIALDFQLTIQQGHKVTFEEAFSELNKDLLHEITYQEFLEALHNHNRKLNEFHQRKQAEIIAAINTDMNS